MQSKLEDSACASMHSSQSSNSHISFDLVKSDSTGKEVDPFGGRFSGQNTTIVLEDIVKSMQGRFEEKEKEFIEEDVVYTHECQPSLNKTERTTISWMIDLTLSPIKAEGFWGFGVASKVIQLAEIPVMLIK